MTHAPDRPGEGSAATAARRVRAFVGREEELRTLQALLRATDRGPTGRVVVVRGEGGIGKSTLIDAALARDPAGRAVLRATADEMDQRRPFGVLLEAFCSAEDGRHADLTGQVQQGAARLVEQQLGAGAAGPAGSEFVIREQLLGLVDVMAAAPFLLVIEDLQWADPESLALLARLGRTLSQLPLIVLCSLRSPAGSAGGSDVERLLSGLRERNLLSIVDLAPLPAPACGALVEQLTGARVDDALAEQVASAGGNPLFLTEMVRALDRDGSLTVAPDGTARLTAPASRSPSLAMVVMHHLGYLQPATRDLLGTAALLGTHFPLAHLRVVAGQPMSDLLPALREALSSGVLEETSHGLLGFRHALIQEVLLRDIPATARAELHREVAGLLDEADAPAATVAEHLLRAPTAREDLPRMLRLADRNAAGSAATAAELWRRVGEATTPGDPLHARAAAGLALSALRSGHAQEAERIARAALAQGPPAQAMASLWSTLTHALLLQGQQAEARTEAERAAVSEVLEPSDRAAQLAFAGWPRFMLGDLAGAWTSSVEAAAVAATVGNRAAEIFALVLQGHIANCRGELATATEVLARAVDLADHHPGLAEIEAFPHAQAAVALADVDRMAEADALLDRGRRTAEAVGYVTGVFAAFSLGAQARSQSANLADLEADLDARDSLLDSIDVRLEPVIVGLRARVAARQHGPDAAEPWLRRLQELHGAPLRLGRGRAWIYGAESAQLSVLGDDRRALEVLWGGWRECRAGEMLMDCAEMGLELVLLARRVGGHAETTARGPGREPEAHRIAEVVEVLADLADRNPTVTHLRGTGLAVRGAAAGDRDALVEGAGLLGTTPRRLQHAQVAELAALAVAAGGGGSEASALAEASLRDFAEVGADHELARARAALHRAGIRVTGRRTPRPSRGWEALTPTEEKIARQVATGASNPEIAEVLFLSRRTVESHVSHVLAKLGLRSRTELVLHVARRSDDVGEHRQQVHPAAERRPGLHTLDPDPPGRGVRVVQGDLDEHASSLTRRRPPGSP